MRISQLLKSVAACAIIASAPAGMASAQNLMGVTITQGGESNVAQSITLGHNKSTVIELQRPAADVIISNPEIADVIVQTPRQIIFRGVEVGYTNAIIFDADGNQLLDLEIQVDMDMAGLHALIERHVPGARIQIEAVNGSILVTGNTNSLSQSDQVLRLVRAYSGAEEGQNNIVNMMSIHAGDQVMLQVRLIEMQRNVVKQLGINLSGVASRMSGNIFGEGNKFDISSALGYSLSGSALGGLSGEASYVNLLRVVDPNSGDVSFQQQSSVGSAIDALERVGVVRTLAEPNLVATSGESAKFLAGGEFPVPVGQDDSGRITLEFKEYGVGLGFTPVVLSEGRISLKISTEVSELTNQGAFNGTAGNTVDANGNVIVVQGLTVPALAVRRVESTIELPSGQTAMLAGLIQSRQRQAVDQVPGLGNLPGIGAGFRTRDMVSDETELVIIVTPYLVEPTSNGELRTPADGFSLASDSRTVLFGDLNRQYGQSGADAPDSSQYVGPVGFIEE